MTFFENDSGWKRWYIKNNIHTQEVGLVQTDGVKQCALCKERKYAVEYIDFIGGLQDGFVLSYKADAVLGDPEDDYFVDRLLPVCNSCVRMRKAKPDGKFKKSPTNGMIGRDILRMFDDLLIECDRCAQDTQIADLMMMSSKSQVGGRCQQCAKAQIQNQFG